jgi:tetratricopeptide (TPR) repeat protein
LGVALALFTIEPRTKTNFNEAQQLLTALIDENPDDDYGIAATYYQARLLEAHADEPNRQSAISIYRQLLRDHPGHPVAEFAAPKLAFLLLYDDVPPETWEEHYAEFQALRPNLQTTAAQRDTLLVLADALLNLRQDKVRAFPHLKYCDDAGLINRIMRQSVVLIQLAESARALGLKTEAQHYYTR